MSEHALTKKEFANRFMSVCKEVMFPLQPLVPLRVVRPETFESVLKKHAKSIH